MSSANDLRALARRRSEPSERAEAISAVLPDLGWAPHAIRRVRGHGLEAELLEVAAANETQALVVLSDAEPPPGARVALGYSREAPYVFHWGSEELAVLDPVRWRAEPGDLPLAQADVARAGLTASVLELLHRDAVLDRVPSQFHEEGSRHEVLHELLADAVGRLRIAVAQQQALGGSEPTSCDAAVLRLFHQLLFVRFQEDWGRASSQRRLSDLVQANSPQDDLAALLVDYRRSLNSDLFAEPVPGLLEIPSGTLREVVRALIAPWEELKLNFSVSRAEIAGRLYQSYLRRAPVLIEDPERGDALLPLVGGQDQRTLHGSYYTPASVASFLTEQTLGRYLGRIQPETPEEVRVLDPACGSGTFLIAAYRLLLSYFERRHGVLGATFRERLLTASIFGADVDERALGLAQLQLLEEAELESDGQLPELGQNLFSGDALLSPPGAAEPGGVPWGDLVDAGGRYHVVLMNPPFGSPVSLARHLDEFERRRLRARYPEVRAWGSDYAYFFVALALRVCAEGGQIGTILPRTALVGPSALALRRAMLERGVNGVVDFRGLRLFEDVSSYVTAVTFGGGAAELAEVADVSDSRERPERVLDDLKGGQDAVVRRTRISRRALEVEAESGWSAFGLRWAELGAGIGRKSGLLAGPDGKRRLVIHGTQSGADARLVLRAGEWTTEDERHIRVGAEVVPARYAPRLVRGAAIHPFRIDQDGSRLLVPFEDDGRPAEDEHVQALLAARGGRGANPQPGDLTTLRAPKILVRRFAREPAMFHDAVGDLMIQKGSGGALAVREVNSRTDRLAGLEALFHSHLYQWLLRGLGGPRSDETVEFSTTAVGALPWPELALEGWSALAEAGAAVRSSLRAEAHERVGAYWDARAALDDLVEELLELEPRLRDTARREVLRPG